VVLAGSDVVPVPGAPDLDAEQLRLAEEAVAASGVGSTEPPGAEAPASPASERE
jgi:hypothetical protein